MLQLHQLLNGDANRLRYITRFPTAYASQRETTAEHCFYTALYSMMIGMWVNDVLPGHVSMSQLLEQALVHDLEEARTGDVFRPFKHSNPELKKAIDAQGLVEVCEIFHTMLPGSVMLADELCEKWERAKDTYSPEGCIVAFADYLSVMGYVWQEARVANSDMHVHAVHMLEYAQKSEASEFNFMRELVDQAKLIWQEVFGDGDA